MANEELDIIIVGAGIAGINSCYRIQTGLPEYSYTVLEARTEIGGTWSFFKYPGIRSDSDLFTFGFEWDPWIEERAIATAPSILKYMREVAERHGIDKHIRFGHKVVALDWSSVKQRWKIDVIVDGVEKKSLSAKFVIMGTGYYDYEEGLSTTIPGLETFQGTIAHPQFWPEDLDYANKRVVIIGSGATAVTLLPSMTDKAAHVTMLQRSPGYFIESPTKNPLNSLIKRFLPSRWASKVIRWRFYLLTMIFYWSCQIFPNYIRKQLLANVAKELPPSISVDPHFIPKYKPWEQRMCMTPDNDFFVALRSKKASVVTGHIETVTRTGIKLKPLSPSKSDDTKEIGADVIITATGLKLQLLGGIPITLDGDRSSPIQVSDKFLWRGSMLQDVPNLALIMSYANASWTLGADATARTVVRILKKAEAEGATSIVPRVAKDEKIELYRNLTLHSNYILDAIRRKALPKAGIAQPWRPRLNYMADSWFADHGDTKGLEFVKKVSGKIPRTGI